MISIRRFSALSLIGQSGKLINSSILKSKKRRQESYVRNLMMKNMAIIRLPVWRFKPEMKYFTFLDYWKWWNWVWTTNDYDNQSGNILNNHIFCSIDQSELSYEVFQRIICKRLHSTKINEKIKRRIRTRFIRHHDDVIYYRDDVIYYNDDVTFRQTDATKSIDDAIPWSDDVILNQDDVTMHQNDVTLHQNDVNSHQDDAWLGIFESVITKCQLIQHTIQYLTTPLS